MKRNNLKVIRTILLFFMITLLLSGITAIPVDLELRILLCFVPENTTLAAWLNKVLSAYGTVKENYGFLLYGYDWLAFAHIVLAILFIGPYRDPVRNIWVIEFGMIACVLIFPLAFIAGSLRGIPWGWILIDCSFGVFGFIPLYVCYRKTKNVINNNQ
ncbi:MAG TPA: hypothetical protein VM101_10540 [Flavitalea sp.]|nr:hypothetical protein [Flavitalea sp.]